MSILQDIWREHILPTQNRCPAGEPFRRLRRQSVQQEAVFLQELSGEGRKAYEALLDKEAEASALLEEQAFAQGFRLALRLMLDGLAGNMGV